MNDREQWAETGVGALVLLAAVVFLIYALAHAGGLTGRSGYELSAKFGSVGGLAPGAAVRVAGVKVGTVTRIDLDPKTFLAKAEMLIDPKVQLPADSTVKITQDSLLGGNHLAVEPGGSVQNMKAGAEFENVQGAVDLFGLIGQVLRPSAASQSSLSAPPASTPSRTPAPNAAASPAPG